MICEKNILQITLDFGGGKILARWRRNSCFCPGHHIITAVRRKKSGYLCISGADYVSQDGSPFHDPGTLIKSNKNQSCDHMATNRAHPGGVIPR